MKCPKCSYDTEAVIENAMMQASKCYNTVPEPSWIAERAVPIKDAIRIAKQFCTHPTRKETDNG